MTTCHCSCTCSAGPHPIVAMAQEFAELLASTHLAADANWQERLRVWEGLRKVGGVGRYGAMSIHAEDRPGAFSVTREDSPAQTTPLANACAELLWRLGGHSPSGLGGLEAVASRLRGAVEAEMAAIRHPNGGPP